MNGHEHIEQGEHELAVADTKTTYSDAARAHVERATAHFTAAVAIFLGETDPAELRDDEVDEPLLGYVGEPVPGVVGPPSCDGSCGERTPHPVHFEPLA